MHQLRTRIRLMTIMKTLDLQVFEIYYLCFASCNRTFSTRPRKHASIVKGVSARQETHVRPFREASHANVCHVLRLPDLVTELCAISSRERGTFLDQLHHRISDFYIPLLPTSPWIQWYSIPLKLSLQSTTAQSTAEQSRAQRSLLGCLLSW